MDFGKKDFDLLTELQKVARAEDWDKLMDHRITVIHKHVILTHGNEGISAKEALNEALEIYEKLRGELCRIYGVVVRS